MYLLGILISFGTFQTYYQKSWPDINPTAIASIGIVQVSLLTNPLSAIAANRGFQFFCLFFGGFIIGPAFDHVGARFLMSIGIIVLLISFICTSFSHGY